MTPAELQQRLDQVRHGELPRRAFVAQLAALGMSAPIASALLLHAGIAQAQTEPTYKPTRRGGGGTLKMLFWQGPTLLNPHFGTGSKDQEGARLFYEPLVLFDAEANMVPLLVAEVPSRANGGLAADGKSVLWKLKRGVTWHDGMPFTADDVVFNWQFGSDPATAAFTAGVYRDLKFEKVDSHTVRVLFNKPTPFWAGAYSTAELIPKHLFAAYSGAKSRDAPANLKPVGTGPYRFLEFKPGDLVKGELNPNYHLPNRPHFDSVEIKGGGDAVSAARAVLQTGEYDFAWNLAVEDEILKRLETGGKGRVLFTPGGNVEHVQINFSDPFVETEGERGHPKSRHPVLSELVVRQALALLVDRQSIQDNIYGRGGVATANYLNYPLRYRSPNQKAEFSIDKANVLLESAGWKRGADGVREKAGKKLKFLFQTSTNAPRQKVQAIMKQACQKAGIELELKAVNAAVFFSSDVGNPDTSGKFWADLQMFTVTLGSPDPERFMQRFTSVEAASKANKWLGRNVMRWQNPAYDALFKEAEYEMDPVKRAALFIRLNDLPCSDVAVIPLVYRPDPSGAGNKIVTRMSGLDLVLGFIHDWYRDT